MMHVEMMASGWTTEETRALISVWSQANVQTQLDRVWRNRVIYKGIERELAALGYSRSWKQCRTKMKNLIQRYRTKMKNLIQRYRKVSNSKRRCT